MKRVAFTEIDLVELAIAVALWTQRRRIEPWIRKAAPHPRLCAAALAIAVIVLRLALLPLHPVPTPAGADDFSYLLLGDTLAHGRFANATHPMHKFFETNYVLQEPHYSSIYPPGQGIVLALGSLLFRQPWAGVLLSMALLSSIVYWMLRAWLPPGWALIGGIVCAIEFGPLNAWTNIYWGGALSAVAGALVFGALPRLARGRDEFAVLLGFGAGLQMISRPYESLFLIAAAAVYAAVKLNRRRLLHAIAYAAAGTLPCVVLLAAHNHAVTGRWTTLPYALSRWEYGIPTTFTFQPLPEPHRTLTVEQESYFAGQSAAHGDGESVRRYAARLASRAHYYLFFWPAPLLLALPFFVMLLRRFRWAWMLGVIALFALGCNFYPYFFPQYIAALTGLFVLSAIGAVRRMAQWNRGAAAFVLLLCAAHFIFWYAVHAFGDLHTLQTLAPQESDAGINFDDPEGRVAVNAKLAAAPGTQLVLVRYFPNHGYHEWVHNGADIDSERVVWALERSPAENAELQDYFKNRKVWLCEPDAVPPKLIPYPKTAGPFLTVE